jgi:hypothetical protein
MPKMRLHFEIVPVEVAEKILERQSSQAKRNGNRKIVARKSKKLASKAGTSPKSVEVLIP